MAGLLLTPIVPILLMPSITAALIIGKTNWGPIGRNGLVVINTNHQAAPFHATTTDSTTADTTTTPTPPTTNAPPTTGTTTPYWLSWETAKTVGESLEKWHIILAVIILFSALLLLAIAINCCSGGVCRDLWAQLLIRMEPSITGVDHRAGWRSGSIDSTNSDRPSEGGSVAGGGVSRRGCSAVQRAPCKHTPLF